MANLMVGYLFKMRYVTFGKRKYEIYKFVDYVAGIVFTNKEYQNCCNILSGNNAGICAYCQKTGNPEGFSFLGDDIDSAIEINNNIVNFIEIRKVKFSRMAKYYLNSSAGLVRLKDSDLINYLEEKEGEVKSGFAEGKFEKCTDISAMYSSIKKTIISQDEQIMQILTALFKNQKVVESSLDIDLIAKLKENILICGSTGTGKTEILKIISKLYNIPIVIEDATSLSETGYQGRKITDMLENLCLAANGDIKLAEKGILVIDEFDKLAEKSVNSQFYISRLGVQRSLLKLLDGALFYFDNKKFDTSRLTVVGIGAFTGITDGDDYKKLTIEDFIQYGIMRELIGRFSKTIAMNSLEKNDIIKILRDSDFSPLNTYKKLFEILQVEFEFDDDFIEYIAEIAITKNSGARSLKTVFDDCVSSALFRIFTGEYSRISLTRPISVEEKPYVLTRVKKI